ncbi:MAG TPA: selenocysteine-specific translation elongation factor [Planctomycetota bacterium]|jgi:selenocysteine-specific elongation factor
MAERRFKPEFAQALVGTAGHVDHGKTSLVKLLTGCDTDRLPEEKARGLSIDLGFAPCLLPGKRIVGIVDVPGHSDFIRNMVAGAASIDVLMLVVAADDGIMPQTEEHVKILKLLRTPQVFVALTKIDLVSPERLVAVRQDLADFLTRMGFPDAPIIGVSNKTCDGLDEIRTILNTMVERAAQRTADQRVFRMNVERTFSVKGLGTVVTGIPLSGSARLGEKAELLPGAIQTAVRTIQTFKFDTDVAQAHVCAAINLRDVQPEKALRGMTLCAPGVFRAVNSIIASIQNISDSFCYRRATDLKFHTGTAVVLATAKLIGADELRPGHEGFAQIRLEEPIVLAAGDQYIVRSLSPVATVGGGTVLSARAQQVKQQSADYLERLQHAAQCVRDGDLLGAEALAGPQAVLSGPEIVRLTQLPEALAKEAAAAKQKSGELADLGAGAWLVAARKAELLRVIEPVVAHYHRTNKYAWGLAPAHVCRLLKLDPGSFAKLAEVLCAGGTLSVKHGRLALASFQPAVSAVQMKLREDLLARITAAGINAPARGDLITALGIGEQDMKLMIQLLAEEGSIKVLDKNLISYEVYASCRQKLVELFASKPVVDITTFRQAVGASRNLAFSMLDAFDIEGLTRRVENGRVLVKR